MSPGGDSALDHTPATAPRIRDKMGAPIDLRAVDPLLSRILVQWRPEQIWLFGSRARGAAHPISDWDLLVVAPDDAADSSLDPLVAWRVGRQAAVRADIVVCRAADFAEFRRTPNTLFFEVDQGGVLVYER